MRVALAFLISSTTWAVGPGAVVGDLSDPLIRRSVWMLSQGMAVCSEPVPALITIDTEGSAVRIPQKIAERNTTLTWIVGGFSADESQVLDSLSAPVRYHVARQLWPSPETLGAALARSTTSPAEAAVVRDVANSSSVELARGFSRAWSQRGAGLGQVFTIHSPERAFGSILWALRLQSSTQALLLALPPLDALALLREAEVQGVHRPWFGMPYWALSEFESRLPAGVRLTYPGISGQVPQRSRESVSGAYQREFGERLDPIEGWLAPLFELGCDLVQDRARAPEPAAHIEVRTAQGRAKR